ncbi:MAG: zinc-ribbon domain-containing protein [Clostridia bacterium]|nr:zinc-ribbon domain-containing protein [Clostridia bacterium]
MICKNCGKEIPDEAKFCKFCGEATSENETSANNNVVAQNSNETVKVIFQRKKKMMGWAIPMRIDINGNRVASLKNGESYEIDLAPGKYKVVIDTVGEVNPTELEFTPENNKVYITLVMKMGLVTGRGVIESIVKE